MATDIQPDRGVAARRAATVTAAEALAVQLGTLGVRYVFGVRDASGPAVLTGFAGGPIPLVLAPHGLTAAHAAAGYARAAGRPGVLLTGGGAALTSTVGAIAAAARDAVPLVVICAETPGSPGPALASGICRPFVKDICSVRQAVELSQYMERAFWIAGSGRPGPVLVDLPGDLLSRRVAPRLAVCHPSVRRAARPALSATTAERIADLLLGAQHPIVYVAAVLDWAARDALRSLAEHLDLPVAHAAAGKGCLLDDHPLAVGMTGDTGSAAANGFLADADIVLAIGSAVGLGPARARIIQIDVDLTGSGPVEIGAVADPGLALRAIGAAVRARASQPASRPAVRERIAASRAASHEALRRHANSDAFTARLERLLADVRSAVPADTILVADAGPWTGWLVSRYALPATGRFIVATDGSTDGSTVGYGPAAAVGIQLSSPGRVVVALVDEASLATQLPAIPMAVEYRLPVVFVVVRSADGAAGAHRTATGFDLAGITRACGAHSQRIVDTHGFGPALRAALRLRRPVVLDASSALGGTAVDPCGPFTVESTDQLPAAASQPRVADRCGGGDGPVHDDNKVVPAAGALVDQMQSYGVAYVFGTRRSASFALLEAFARTPLQFVVACDGHAAALAALGYARATGNPGVLLLGPGPAGTAAMSALAAATLDAVPVVAICTGIPSYDVADHYRPFAKRTWRLRHADDLGRLIELAFWTATSGQPGAVLVDVPAHVFFQLVPDERGGHRPLGAAPAPDLPAATARAIAAMLAGARQPLIYLGRELRDPDSRGALLALAEHLDIPIAHSREAKGSAPDDHPLVLGPPGPWVLDATNRYVLDSDVILALNTRFGEINADPRHASTWTVPPARLVRIDIDPAAIGHGFPAEIGAVADTGNALTAIATAMRAVHPQKVVRQALRDQLNAARTALADHRQRATSDEPPLLLERVLTDLRDTLPEDAVLVLGTDPTSNEITRCYPLPAAGRIVSIGRTSPSGSAAAAAIGVQIGYPHRVVAALVRDGAMRAQLGAIATAVELRLPVIFVVLSADPGGDVSHDLVAPDDRQDIGAIARALGADSYAIGSTTELTAALHNTVGNRRPALLDVCLPTSQYSNHGRGTPLRAWPFGQTT